MPVAVEELHLDSLVPAQLRGAPAVHPVDHPHRLPMYQDRRQTGLDLRQRLGMLEVLPLQPR